MALLRFFEKLVLGSTWVRCSPSTLLRTSLKGGGGGGGGGANQWVGEGWSRVCGIVDQACRARESSPQTPHDQPCVTTTLLILLR